MSESKIVSACSLVNQTGREGGDMRITQVVGEVYTLLIGILVYQLIERVPFLFPLS